MGNNLNADEIITQKHVRNFIQFGGPRPANQVQFAGQGTQYMMVDGVSNPETGGIDPQWVHDPTRQGLYRLVGRSITPPDLPQATVTMREKHGSIPRQLTRIGCSFNFYELIGVCRDLTDFTGGWSDYILVYSGAIVTDKDLGSRSSFDSDDPLQEGLSVTLSEIYPVGSLNFGEGAATQIDREVAGVVYGSRVQCGSCGAENDGSAILYAVTKSSAGSPGLVAELITVVNGVVTQQDIDGIGASEDPVGIEIMGNYVVVISATAIYYALINSDTGLAGTFTKVTTGIVQNLTDIYVAGPREAYLSGLAGYIYKAVDITAGVTAINAGSATSSDLQRITGKDDVIVAVGDSGALVRSLNRGKTFASTTTSPVAANTLGAVAVMDAKRIWVGTLDSGRLYYTINGGETWTEVAFSGYGSGAVRDIKFATDEVGYFAHNTSTPTGRVFTTYDGGVNWINSASNLPRLVNFPTCDYAGRLAVPNTDAGVAANNLAVGGLAGNGTDGILVLGVAART